MKLETTTRSVLEIEAEAIVVPLRPDGPLPSATAQVDEASGHLITRLQAEGELSGKVGDATLLFGLPQVAARIVCVAGQGNATNGPAAALAAFRSAATAAKCLAGKPRQTIANYVAAELPIDLQSQAVCGSLVGCVGQDIRRQEKRLQPCERQWFSVDVAALREGRILAEGMNLARQLVNAPPSDLDPVAFVERASRPLAAAGLTLEVWDEARLKSERCGALLAVARGSKAPPRLLMAEHRPGDANVPTVALIGKGVTFDSGGLSLKPSDSMKTMKCDMAGAATVVGTMLAVAQLDLPVRVLGLVGLAENMVSGDSYKLGDVLTARSGKTIEVLNTDAEGRLVMADVLDVAVERGAERLIDLATLTGACVVALGMDVAGLMTNNSQWCNQIRQAAHQQGEPVWELPMFDFFAEQIRSQVADIKNVGDGRWGGAITAAKFLEAFVQDRPWTHIDIAGPAFLERPKPWLDAGGSGCLVRTLVATIRALKQ